MKNMEKTVNQRIIQLKTDSNLTDMQFCTKASISTGTLFRIKNGETISPKVIGSIATAFNISRDWLLTGQGEKVSEAIEEGIVNGNPWKDEAYSVLKNENSRMAKEIDRLWQMLQHVSGGAKPNFPKTLSLVGAGQPALLRA